MDFKFDIFNVKQRAWNGLRSCYWNALVLGFLSSVLISIASGIVSRVVNVVLRIATIPFGVDFERYLDDFSKNPSLDDAMTLIVIMSIVSLTSVFVSFLLNTFANEPIAVGQKKAFMDLRNGKMSIDNVCFGFTKDYKNVIKASALKWIYITLGSIIVIPGIIFTYRYMLVPYILAENPSIDYQRALSISRTMMRGNKFRAWLMQLSFIGWWLLGMIACCIGEVFVMPYYLAAETEMYYELRSQAVASGYVLEAELSGIQIIED